MALRPINKLQQATGTPLRLTGAGGKLLGSVWFLYSVPGRLTRRLAGESDAY